MTNEKDKALALKVVREIDAAFESSERLRLGRWVLPDEREQTLASFIVNALTTVRKEEREAAFKEARNVVGELGVDDNASHEVREGFVQCRRKVLAAIEAAVSTKGENDA